ncbi:MAG: CHRD domain-containing protein, partial [Panacagrimonas sp.]
MPFASNGAAGSVRITNYDMSTRTFDIEGVFGGIAPGEITGFDLHSGAVGETGPVILRLLGRVPITPTSDGFGFAATNLTMPAEHEVAFLSTLTYLNVSTRTFPDGHVRGQVMAGVSVSSGKATGTGGIAT